MSRPYSRVLREPKGQGPEPAGWGRGCSYDEEGRSLAPILVTASVDAIQLKHRLSLDNDLSVTGKVVWTGRSSMDIRLELRQVPPRYPEGPSLGTPRDPALVP